MSRHRYESSIYAQLVAEGYTVHTTGWPDFCATREKNGRMEVRLIEVKAANDFVRGNQMRIHDALRVKGVEVEVIQEIYRSPAQDLRETVKILKRENEALKLELAKR